MTDVSTSKPLHVRNEGGVGPYIDVPFMQLDELKQILDSHGISYWVAENVISIDGGPEIATVEFGRQGNEVAIQAAIDSAQ